MTTNLLKLKPSNNVLGFGSHIIDSEPVWYHRHNFYEVFYIIEGEVIHYVNEKSQKLVKGDLVFLSLEDAHTFSYLKGTRCIRRDIMIMPELFEAGCNYFSADFKDKFFSRPVPTVYHISPGKLESFEKKINLFLLNGALEPSFALQLAKSLIIDLLNLFIQSKITERGTRQPEWLSGLMSKFSDTSMFKKDTEKILKDYHYNVSYMRRAFKNYTNLTMTEYRKKKQLEYAKYLLTSTNETIEKIADVCGFNNVTYFYRYFKSQEGISPKTYRDTPFVSIP